MSRWYNLNYINKTETVEFRFSDTVIKELLVKMLDYDYTKRITAKESLEIIKRNETTQTQKRKKPYDPPDSKRPKIEKKCTEEEIRVMRVPELIQQLKLHGIDEITRGSEIVDLRNKLIHLCKKITIDIT